MFESATSFDIRNDFNAARWADRISAIASSMNIIEDEKHLDEESQDE